MLVEVSATILEPDGNPWPPIPVRVDVTGPSGAISREDVIPDASGLILACLYLPVAGLAGQGCNAAIWADPFSVSLRGNSGPFLSQYEGQGGFSTATAVAMDSGQYALDLGFVTMALPPLTATVVINPAVPYSSYLGVVPGNSNQLETATGPWFDWRASFGPGLSGFSVYSWGVESWYNFEVVNDDYSVVAGGVVRRTGTATVSFYDDVRFQVDVDMAVYPTAFRVVFAEVAQHQPNPAAPSGSNVSFGELWDDTSHGALTSSGDLGVIFMTASDYYVQLWGTDTTNSFAKLLAWKYSPFNTGSVTISFP